MATKIYMPPQIDIIDVEIEQGFATTVTPSEWENGSF